VKSDGPFLRLLRVEHNAIELMLRWLYKAIFSGAGGAEVIEILDASIEFCATLFADEEKFMRKNGRADVMVHAMVHSHLLAKLTDARWYASGEGLSLAVLDAVDTLHELKDHVNTHDRDEIVVPEERRQQLAMGTAS
jgi:hemerythrin